MPSKTPPHSLEAEQSVLGALFLDNRAWDKIADRVNEADFYRREHRLIFQAMDELGQAHRPFDVLTVAEKLRLSHQLETVGGEPFLYTLANNTPTAANIVAYADIVRERS